MLPLDSGQREQVFLGKLVVGGNFVCCLVMVIAFMKLGGTYWLGNILLSSYGGQATKGWDIFYGGELTP